MVYTAPIRDADGNIEKVVEMSADITQIRQLQDKLSSVGLLIGSISKTFSDDPRLTEEHKNNRLKLNKVMRKHGFRYDPGEWWHFYLDKEPFPHRYFDFVVE